MHSHLSTHICTCACAQIHTLTHTYACTYISTHTKTHSHACTYVSIHIQQMWVTCSPAYKSGLATQHVSTLSFFPKEKCWVFHRDGACVFILWPAEPFHTGPSRARKSGHLSWGIKGNNHLSLLLPCGELFSQKPPGFSPLYKIILRSDCSPGSHRAYYILGLYG